MYKFKHDLTSRKFGKLTVEKYAFSKNGRAGWLCKCECGNEKVVSSGDLLYGQVKSCGCLHKATKHNLSNTKIYSAWKNIKARCYNKNSSHYNCYGARGISVCEEWKNNFMAFYNWSINNGYKEGLSIDRIDNNGNYEPNNCRWCDRITQANNTRTNHFITYNGKTQTITQWSRELGLSRGVLWNRIYCYKWTIERALTEKVNKKYRRHLK